MSDDPITWVVAAVEVTAAVIFALFWITWFRTDHDEPWLPAGYVDHETPFVFTDTMVAVVLVAGALLQILEEPAGASLGLVAGGMLAFLGVLDTAYFARTGLFRREHEGVVNAAIVIAVLALSIVLIVRFF